MDVFNSSENMIVVMASSQVGKTEIALNIMGYYMAEDPSPIMYLLPTDGFASDFSKTRIEPSIKATPVLRDLFVNCKDSDNTIELKTFASGYLAIYGSQSPTKLSSKAIRVLIADELDRFLDILRKEGSPFKLALQRTTNFWNSKVLAISTPTVKETSQIVALFEKSDKRYYHVPCPDCEHEFVLNWQQVKWMLDDKQQLIVDSVYLECPACFFKIIDKHKPALLANGKWIATAPHKTMPGFHISSLYSPWVKLADLAAEFVEASSSGNNAMLREFINLKLGEPFEEILLELDPELLLRRREFYNCELPDGILYLTCGVDTQGDRLEYQIIGWGIGYQAWVIQYGVIYGDLTLEQPWKSLDAILFQKYLFADGRELPIHIVFIDSAGNHTNDVYKYTMLRNQMNVYPIVGRSGDKSIIANISKNNVYKTTLITVGVDAGKSRLFRSLHIEEFGAGYIHFPREESANCNSHYFNMLTSEKNEVVLKSGRYVSVWTKITVRNEALDTFVYALAGLEMLKPNFEEQAILVANLPTAKQQIKAVTQKPKRRIISSVGGIYD